MMIFYIQCAILIIVVMALVALFIHKLFNDEHFRFAVLFMLGVVIAGILICWSISGIIYHITKGYV